MSKPKKARLHLTTPTGFTRCGVRTVNLWRGVLTTKLADTTCGNCLRFGLLPARRVANG